jgi:hypothetical protein
MDSGTIFSILVCVAAAIAVALFIARWRETARPIKHEPAIVVAKRSMTSGYPAAMDRQVSTQYFATFELKSGRRMEFEVRGPEFGLMVEGDTGTLSRRGRRYLGFGREHA